MRQFCLRSKDIVNVDDPGYYDLSFEGVVYLLKHPEHQLRNLANSIPDFVTNYDILSFLDTTDIPFKKVQRKSCAGTCCCKCTSACYYRCPQDVMYRAYLLGGYLVETPPEHFDEVFKRANIFEKSMYSELTSEHPRAIVVMSILSELLKSHAGDKHNRPDSLVYSPVCEMETVIKSHGKDGDYITRKVVDPETGYAKVVEWPRSGVCPYCVSSGLIMRNRIANKGDRRSKNWKEKFYEY